MEYETLLGVAAVIIKMSVCVTVNYPIVSVLSLGRWSSCSVLCSTTNELYIHMQPQIAKAATFIVSS